MILLAYLVGIGVFVLILRRVNTGSHQRELSILSLFFGAAVVVVGAFILVRGHGGLATAVGVLALSGGLAYLLAAVAHGAWSRSMMMCAALLIVCAFAIPSVLTLFFPFVAAFAAVTVRDAGYRPDSRVRSLY